MRATSRWALVILTASAACAPESDDGLEQRRAEVAETGAAVMPFDLDRSTHVFEKIEGGGLQQVVSDTGDPEQIDLIRDHLEEEAARFAKGDFHDPQMIHGEDMAGLHELMTGADRLTVEYRPIDAGGQILYSTDDPALVAAIHAWFDAQTRDHGAHARSHR